MATFYIEAIETGSITLSKKKSPTVGTCNYGINDTSVPNSYTYGSTINLNAGDKCYFTITSTSTNFDYYNYLYFTSTNKINTGGNLSDLIGGTDLIPRNYCFHCLFYNCTKLINAEDLILCGNFNNKTYCYSGMFSYCTSLITYPSLNFTSLTSYCYYQMFSYCRSLVTAPELPATTLADYCYYGMFSNCLSLTEAPELPATTSADYCYYRMFRSCSSLVNPPIISLTVTYTDCCRQMFSNCTSLIRAPELLSTKLSSGCYYEMFSSCVSLKYPPSELPASNLSKVESEACIRMFYYCRSLITLPLLSNTSLGSLCYSQMFYGCTSIKLSETQTGNYTKPFRIPTSGSASASADSLSEMFVKTGGTFTGTPLVDTTYYLWENSPIYIGNKKMQDGYIGNKKINSMFIGETKIFG